MTSSDEFRHEQYWAPMPMTAPKYYRARGRGHGRIDRPRMAKLTRAEVDSIRRWACTTGFGLTVTTQARLLAAMYPGISPKTLAQILRNEAWHDPDFDRTRPVVLASDPHWILHCPRWVLALVLLCQTYRSQ